MVSFRQASRSSKYGLSDQEFDNTFYAVGRSFAVFSGSCAPEAIESALWRLQPQKFES